MKQFENVQITFFENFLERARIVVGVTVRENNTIDKLGVNI